MEGEGPTYSAHRTMQSSQEDQPAKHAVQETGPVNQSASVIMKRVK
jgi:hypothetical protein